MKKLTVFLLCILMMSAMAVPAFAAGHDCAAGSFDKALSGELRDSLAPGSYYLEDDCVLANHIKIDGDVKLCLNGHKIHAEAATTFDVLAGGTLSIYDGEGGGLIGYAHDTPNNNHPAIVFEGGTLNLYGGTLYAKNGSNAINNNGGTVNIYGGSIISEANGYCAIKNERGTVNIYGGSIVGDAGISQRGGGAFIYIKGCDFSVESTISAFQYVETEYNIVSVEIQDAYRWRTTKTGDFTDSQTRPYVFANSQTYIEMRPVRGVISYETDGGTLSDGALTEFDFGAGAAITAAAEKEGFNFLGWALSADSRETVTEIGADVKENVTLYAVYEEIIRETPRPIESKEPPAVVEVTEPEPPQSSISNALVFAVVAVILISAILVLIIRFARR